MIPKHVNDRFVAPLLAIFGEPNTPDPERALSEYARFLSGYSSDELKAAADHLAITFKGPARWPKLAECIDACNDAREREMHKSKRAKPEDDWQKRASDAERFMMTSDAGIDAAKNGYANGMREHLMKHKRLPRPHEVEKMLDNAAFVDRASTGREDLGIAHEALVKLAETFIDRRHAIADRVLNGEVKS